MRSVAITLYALLISCTCRAAEPVQATQYPIKDIDPFKSQVNKAESKK